MAELEIHIKRIQEKLQQLLKKYHDLQRESDQLRKDLARSEKQSSEHQRTIEALRQQVEVLKVTSGNWNEGDKKEFERRINHYIREIDKCIALLGE
jgi:septal ring factor EnvC (AmiA/AmiB activator)